MSDPVKISAALFEECLRACHRAPADKPSLALLKTMDLDPGHFERAVEIAYNAGLRDAAEGIWTTAFGKLSEENSR